MATDPKWANEGVCRSCGKRVLGVKVEGKMIPVDPAPPVYDFNPSTKEWSRSLTACVGHLALCRPTAAKVAGVQG